MQQFMCAGSACIHFVLENKTIYVVYWGDY